MAVVVTQDGAAVSPALVDEGAAFAWLLRHQGQSVDWARQHEGYDVRPATADEVAAGVAWPREEADRLRSLALSNLRGDADHRAGHPDEDEESRHLTRENCAACVLTGYGADTDGAPNYAAWARIYVQAGGRSRRSGGRRSGRRWTTRTSPTGTRCGGTWPRGA